VDEKRTELRIPLMARVDVLWGDEDGTPCGSGNAGRQVARRRERADEKCDSSRIACHDQMGKRTRFRDGCELPARKIGVRVGRAAGCRRRRRSEVVRIVFSPGAYACRCRYLICLPVSQNCFCLLDKIAHFVVLVAQASACAATRFRTGQRLKPC